MFVALAFAVLAGTALSERLRVPAPLLLVALGVAASYLPWVPEVHLSPEVVLVGLLPPLLYATSIQTSLVDVGANRRPILVLSVALVIVTTLGAGAVVHLLLPGLGWPASFAIGAVVAPPDAVAASAVGRRIGLPRDIITILEGEGLLNDATALVALRTAIAAAAGGVSVLGMTVDFLIAAGGGVAVGFLVFALVSLVRRRLRDPLMDTAVSFVTPFVAYLAAEEVHASGLIGVVVAGLLLGHKAPLTQTAQSRILETVNWRTISFVLEHAVFFLIGMQASWLIEAVAGSSLGVGGMLTVCAATLASVIVIRMLWVLGGRVVTQLRPGGQEPEPWAHSVLIGWAGMRGVVTLAAAFVIPADTPHRSVLLLIAFTVVAGTLFLQGLSLPWLTRRLHVLPPDPAEDALARAGLLQQAATAGLARLDELEPDDPHGVTEQIRNRVKQRTFAAWEQLGTVPGQETPSQLYARLRHEMIVAERARVLQVRGEGRVPSEVVRQVLAALDLEESMIAVAEEERDLARGPVRVLAGDQCPDLLSHPVAPVAERAECDRCTAEGLTPVALRQCLSCGHVGCCDSSVGRHATEHFRQTGHPVMQSAEPGENWRWCYIHQHTA